MGLTTWKNVKVGGKIMKSDVSIAKNYLTKNEISELNRVVTMYLDFAENMASRRKQMTMVEWVGRLDAFLSFNEYNILTDAGRISHKIAKQKAEKEYTRFRVIQDKEFISDFDKVVGEIKSTGRLPENISIQDAFKEDNLSNFNKSLKTALDYNPKEKK